MIGGFVERFQLSRNDAVKNGERDRPGRTSRRPADWLDGRERVTKKLSFSARDAPKAFGAAGGTPALVRLGWNAHRRVKVPPRRSFPPVTESNCVMAT